MAGATEDLLFNLKFLGLDDAEAKLDIFLRLFEKAGGFNLNKMQASAVSVAQEFATTEQKVKNLIQTLKSGVKAANQLDRVSNKSGKKVKQGSRAAAKINIDGDAALQETKEITKIIEKEVRKAKPILTLVPKFEIGRFKEQIKELETQSGKVIKNLKEQPSAKAATVEAILNATRKQAEIELKLAKTAKERKNILADVRRLTARLPQSAGIINKSGELSKGVHPSVAKGTLAAIKANERFVTSQEKVIAASKKATATTQSQAAATGKLDKSIGIAIGKLVRYRVAFFAIRGAMDAVKGSLKEFIELQFQLAQLEIVIDRQTDSVNELRDSGFQLATKYGASIKEVVDVMKIWAQTGLKQNEINKATEATLIGMNALGSDAKAVVESLTAAIFTYGIAAEDVTEVLSKWLAVQREFPVSAQDLANSIKVVGAAAKVVGVDLDDLAGLVASISSITRKSGSAVGQSLKTIFARLPRKEVIQAFEGIDIAILKNARDIRDFDDVLDDLSAQWGHLDSVQKASLATTLGGIRRYADFIALMDNYSVKLAGTAIAQRSLSEAQEANLLVMDTFKKQLDSTKASVSAFSASVGEVLAGGLSTLLGPLNSLLTWINEGDGGFARFTGTVISFVGTFALVGLVLLGAKFAWTSLSGAIKGFGVSAYASTIAARDLALAEAQTAVAAGTATQAQIALAASAVAVAAGEEVATVATWSFATSLRALYTSAGGLTLIFVALAAIAGAIFTAMSDTASSTKELEVVTGQIDKAIIKTIKSRKNSIQLLKSEQKQLQQSAVELRRYADILEETNSSNPKQLEALKAAKRAIDVLPKQYGEIRDRVIDYQTALETTPDLIRDIAQANSEATEEVEELIAAQEKSLRLEIIGEIKKIDDTRHQIALLINDLEDLAKSSTIDLDINLDADSLTKVVKERVSGGGAGSQTALQDVEKVVSVDELLRESISGGDGSEIKDALDRQVRIATTALDLAKKDFDKRVSETFTEAQVKEGNIVFDEARAKTLIESYSSIYTRAIAAASDANKTDIKKLNTDELFKFFDSFKTLLAETNVELGEEISVEAIFKKIVEGLANESGELGAIAQDLLNDFKALDAAFLTGRKIPQAVVTLDTSMNKAVQDFDDTIKKYENLIGTLEFGKTLDPGEFEAAAARKLATTTDAALLNANNKVTQLNSDIDELTKLQTKLKTEQDKFSKIPEGDKKTRQELKDILDEFGIRPELQNKLLSSKDALADLRNLLIDLEVQGEEFTKIIEKVSTSEQLKDAREIIVLDNEASRRRANNVGTITSQYKTQVAVLDAEIKILSAFEGKEGQLAALQERRTKLLYEEQIALNANLESTKALEASSKIINQNWEKVKKDILKAKDAKIDIVLKKAADNAIVLRNSLSSAFSNIPANIFSGADERETLAEDLRKAEFELQEARREGDENAITQAQYRLDVVNTELANIRQGWTEIKNIILDVSNSLTKAFQQNLTDEIAKNLSNITIGGVSLGDSIGDAIGRASTQFTDTWKEASEGITTTYFANLKEENDRFLLELRKANDLLFKALNPDAASSLGSNIGNFQVAGSSFDNRLESSGFSIGGKDFGSTFASYALKDGKNSEKTIGELTNLQKTMKSSIALLGTTLAQSFAGSGKGSQAGAGLGSLLGGAIGGSLLKETSSKFLQMAVPGLGSLIGGTVLGGIFSIFNDKKAPLEPLTSSMKDNTDAVLSNTITLKELDRALFNAPTGFNIPARTGGGTQGNIEINIQSNQNPVEIANEVSRILSEQFDEEISSTGSRGFVPN